MGLFKTIFMIGIIIFCVAYFLPNVYETGKNGAFAKISEVLSGEIEDRLDYEITEDGKDYGKIFGYKKCTMDLDCEKYFKIEDMMCSVNGTCYVEVE